MINYTVSLSNVSGGGSFEFDIGNTVSYKLVSMWCYATAYDATTLMYTNVPTFFELRASVTAIALANLMNGFSITGGTLLNQGLRFWCSNGVPWVGEADLPGVRLRGTFTAQFQSVNVLDYRFYAQLVLR